MKRISGITAFIFTIIFLFTGVLAIADPPPTEEEIEASIAAGIAWLANEQNSDGSWGTYNYVSHTALAVIKLEDRAFELDYESPFDPDYPYKTHVEAGLNYIFENAYIFYIWPQLAGDPDTDGDSIGVYFSDHYYRTYPTGIALMAIAGSRDPDRVVTATGDVNGWTYGEVLQDGVDYLAFGQTDSVIVDSIVGDTLSGRGAWGYVENQSWSDNSNSGYAVLGLDFAESAKFGFNATVPQFVKDELNIWIDFIQNDVDGDPEDGGSGYSYPDSWVNILKTGNLIYQMAFYGDEPYAQRVIDAINYIERHWNDNNSDPGFRPHHYQAIYCMMKGFERMGIETINVGGEDIDWFAELATIIVNSQNSDGSWPNDYWGDNVLSAGWALLTLEKVVPPHAILVDVDIKPTSCPNPLNPGSRGVLPVAILGTEEFDVTTIDPATILLDRDVEDDLLGVSPLRWGLEDVAAPYEGEDCGCWTEGADGFMDLTLKFNNQEVVASLGEVANGDVFPLYLTGNLLEEFDGTAIEGSDCIIIRARGRDRTRFEEDMEVLALPEEYALYPVFPNPFNPSTTIRYDLPEANMVDIKIYNTLGQIVTTLVHQNQPAGNYSIQWQPQGLSSGLYLISFNAGEYRKIEKVLYVR
jgi:hypothetical protein